MSVLWQQTTHGVLKRKEKMQRFSAQLLLGIVLVTTALTGIYLTVVASNVHTARRLWAMEYQMSNVLRDNQALITEVARLSSIPVLQERSVALGYQPAESIDYLYLGEP